jgi:hypothetical protein
VLKNVRAIIIVRCPGDNLIGVEKRICSKSMQKKIPFDQKVSDRGAPG